MTSLLMFIGGLAALVVGASLLVRGASKLALALGLSPLVLGAKGLVEATVVTLVVVMLRRPQR